MVIVLWLGTHRIDALKPFIKFGAELTQFERSFAAMAKAAAAFPAIQLPTIPTLHLPVPGLPTLPDREFVRKQPKK